MANQHEAILIELFLSCRDLPPIDALDYNSVIEVSLKSENGQWNDINTTELIRNNNHPVFHTIIALTFFPYQSQTLRFTCYNLKDEKQLNDLKTEFKIGSAEVKFSEIVGSAKGEYTTDLVNHQPSSGKLQIKAIQMAEGYTTINLSAEFECAEAKSNPYFVIFRADDAVGNTFSNEVYRSVVIHDTFNTEWKRIEIPLHDLCFEDRDWQLLFRIMEWNSDASKHTPVGEFKTTLKDLYQQSSFELELDKKKSSSKAPIFKITKKEERISFNKAQYENYRMKLKDMISEQRKVITEITTQHSQTQESRQLENELKDLQGQLNLKKQELANSLIITKTGFAKLNGENDALTKQREILELKLAETEKVMSELIGHTEEGRTMVNDLKEKILQDEIDHKKSVAQLQAKLEKTKQAKKRLKEQFSQPTKADNSIGNERLQKTPSEAVEPGAQPPSPKQDLSIEALTTETQSLIQHNTSLKSNCREDTNAKLCVESENKNHLIAKLKEQLHQKDVAAEQAEQRYQQLTEVNIRSIASLRKQLKIKTRELEKARLADTSNSKRLALSPTFPLVSPSGSPSMRRSLSPSRNEIVNSVTLSRSDLDDLKSRFRSLTVAKPKNSFVQ